MLGPMALHPMVVLSSFPFPVFASIFIRILEYCVFVDEHSDLSSDACSAYSEANSETDTKTHAQAQSNTDAQANVTIDCDCSAGSNSNDNTNSDTVDRQQ